MPAGVEIILEDGFATVTPDQSQRGHVLRALLAAVDHPSLIRTDTSGTRRSYVVLEQDAREAGLLDEKPVPVKSAQAKKAPAKKAAPTKTADQPELTQPPTE